MSLKEKLLQDDKVQDRLKILMDNSSEIMGVIDAASLKFEEVNEQGVSLLCYHREEIIGASLDLMLCDEDRKSLLKMIEDKSDKIVFEARVLCKDQTVKWLRWRIVSTSGKYFFNANDITAMKIVEEERQQLRSNLERKTQEVEEAQRELDSFSYSVSHDLRAPLRSIVGYAQMLEDNYIRQLDSAAKRLFEVVQRNATRMSELIDCLLEFSRMGRREVKKSMIDQMAIVQKLVSKLDKETSGKIHVVIKSLPQVMADFSLINQVWKNLFSNAVKFSLNVSNPVIEIGSFEENNETVFYIKDNGAGFDMAYADKLFGVFQRLHSPKDFDGVGIGLAMTQRIILKHGGKIWAHAKVKEGATFYFTLPPQ